jgi:AMMECR1 domain-containing protein
VQADETVEMKIEISVLTEPRPLNFSSPEELLDKLDPRTDGVWLQIGSCGATFLPQVWVQIPDKVEFLSQLSRKAGCLASAWQGKETTVSVYRVEAFGE